MWFNYHTHSNFCDGKASVEDVVSAAVRNGLGMLGMSSHGPVPFDCKWCMKRERLDEYLQTIDRITQSETRIQLYKSLEIDFIPGIIAPSDFAPRLDYTIGSIHFVDAFPDGKPWEIDGPHMPFLEGLDEIFQGDMQRAITRYFELTREMVTMSPPTVIGHMDKMKIQNVDSMFFDESDSWYRDEVRKTLKVIADSDCIVEVNTRGIYQKKSTTTYPSPWILENINELQIPITISSDAHHPDDLTNQFEETAVMLKNTGFKKIKALHEGEWKSFDYDQHGIIPH